MDNQNLLKPSLSNNTVKVKLFSEQALFFTAFFGSAFAVSIMSAINSYRLQRLKKDCWIYLLGCFAFIALIYFLLQNALTSTSKFIVSDTRLTITIASIVIWFLFFSIHKRTHRVNSFIADGDENPWIVGVISVLIGISVNTYLVKQMVSHIVLGNN